MTGKRIKIIQRVRLLEKLEAAPRVVVIRAPAGYGKSVLLDQWQELCHIRGAAAFRLNLTAEDGEPAHLLGTVGTALGLDGITRYRDLVPSLKAASVPVLLIDDADHLSASPDAGEIVQRLKADVPGLRVVLACRGEMGVRVAKYRASGEVTHLDAEALRFDAQEQQRFFEENAGTRLSGTQSEALNNSFKGWPCGYSLQVQALQCAHDFNSELPSIRGSWQMLSAYFSEEGFDALPPDIKSFLEQVSVLETLDASTCDALLRISESASLLQRAYAAGAYIWPIDPEHRSYEILPLYAEFLRTRLEKGRVAELRERACNLLEEQGEFRAACVHALALSDQKRAAGLLEREIRIDSASRYDPPIIDLAFAIDPQVRENYPLILLTLAMRLIFIFQFEQARKYLDQAKRVISEAPVQACEASGTDKRTLEMLLLHREMLLALGQHDMTRAQSFGDQLLRDIDSIPAIQRVMILNSLTHAQLELYIFRSAERFYVQAKSLIPELTSWISSIPLETFYARFLFMTGRTNAAVELLEKTLDHLVEDMGPQPVLGSIAGVALAEMKFELGEFESARTLLADYGENAEHFGFLSLTLAARIGQARLLIASGEIEEALEMLDHTPVSAGELFDRAKQALAVERIDCLLRLGREQAAKQACQAIGMSLSRLPEPDTCSATNEEAYASTWVRLARFYNRNEDAMHVACKWQRYTEGVGAIRSTVKWNVIIASLHSLAGEKNQAMRALRRAVALGAPGQYRQTLLSEYDVLRDQFETLVHGDLGKQEADFLRSILNDTPDRSHQIAPPGNAPLTLIGTFSSRETAILRLVARGMLNREIGDSLGLTEGTVKWYLQRIYDQLGIRRRSQVAMLVAKWNLGSGEVQPMFEAAE